MKIHLTLVLLLCLVPLFLRAAEQATSAGAKTALVWSDDLAAVKKLAEESGRPVLLNFTGSDWCGWCHRLESEVFSQPVFQDFATEQLLLVVVDFPRNKVIAPELKRGNQALAARYGVNSYPTLILIDHSGAVMGRSSYTYGGAKTFVRMLKKWISDAKTTKPRI